MYNGSKDWPFDVEKIDTPTSRWVAETFGLSCKMEHRFCYSVMEFIVLILKIMDPKSLSCVCRGETLPYASILYK
jgi:hypothetical protein